MINKTFMTVFLFSCGYAVSAQTIVPADINALLTKHTCVTCHQADKKLIGPSFKDIAEKKYSKEKFADLVHNPQPSNWPGYIPMASLKRVPKKDLYKIAQWVNTLAK